MLTVFYIVAICMFVCTLSFTVNHLPSGTKTSHSKLALYKSNKNLKITKHFAFHRYIYNRTHYKYNAARSMKQIIFFSVLLRTDAFVYLPTHVFEYILPYKMYGTGGAYIDPMIIVTGMIFSDGNQLLYVPLL